MKTNDAPTAVQAKTLADIKKYIEVHGYSPTFAELAVMAAVNGNAMCGRISALEKKGLITKTPGIARSIRPARADKDQSRR